ncbi:hypothetical protein EGO51_09065 [Haloarcula hispanica]|uniref:Sulfatase N-terminal domain-containing protein n=1 Tax=Haloarcula hispanica TaxID=51589 RepID=A0A5J5LKE5_HALHI|nr:hypothetical protein [Haloarcula hispanica]KAA9409946.1 hypothetical protein EGO51_09065 [Haloarcula hispanica]
MLEPILDGMRHPSLVSRFLYRNIFGGGGNPNGVDVFEADWDNLIILDACRFDAFQNIACPHFSGSLRKIESQGSATFEWIQQNFSGLDLMDTVYVSANGWLHRIQDSIDASIHAGNWLYTEEFRNGMGTVPPAMITDEALDWADKYPNKRLLVHYVQPHKPFLGDVAEQYFPHARGINMVEMMAQADDATPSILEKAYRETLEIAIPEVKRLVNGLDGKTVISADHGELLGERYPTMPFRNFGHPHGVYVPELVEVPWFECDYDTRREIISEHATSEAQKDEQEIKEHLEAMGYV